MKNIEKISKAFANRRRLAILKYLKEHREASVGEIAKAISLSFKATSRHLSLLSGANLLNKEQRSLQVFYRLSEDVAQFVKLIIKSL